MIRLYLIVGFLGAGKTTFLKNCAAALAPRRLRIIVNEFGREDVDGALLRDAADGVEPIVDGSIFCACRIDQFERALIRAARALPEIILVEASGLSDPLSIRRIMESRPELSGIVYEGCFCLADAVHFKKVLHTVRVARNQLAAADLALVNKTDTATSAEILETEALIREVRPGVPIRRTVFGGVEPRWLESGFLAGSAERPVGYSVKDASLRKALVVLDGTVERRRLEAFLGLFAGNTYRVKGFAQTDGGAVLVDCVGPSVSVRPREDAAGAPGRLTVLSGRELPMEAGLRRAAEACPRLVKEIVWD